ncbi:MAG: D-aminoacyl-tRNA deacylase [Clostridia bacterium]|nr:D-aminoacyl-tRNA deacylase [Clostridia bacterium]
MRAVVQRASFGSVTVDNKVVGQIDEGLVVLIGVEKADGDKDVKYLVDKISGLRIFRDEEDKMNLSVKDIGGSILAISQFTLLGDVRKGKRPSFSNAENPETANMLYQQVLSGLREEGLRVEEGVFQADMMVKIHNNGPVTILLDSHKEF